MADTQIKGISTYMTYLMLGTLSGTTYSYTKMIDIASFPDLMPEPDTIDITTLTDPMRQYMQGIKDPGGNMAFGANYTPTNYNTVHALDDGEPHRLAVWFGASSSGEPDGNRGKFSYDAYVTAQITAGGVNEKVSMNVITTPTSEIIPEVN